ncbi:hypothetical protein C0995_014790 [Termitomyces sp. Mi166|nr:hypothetical protein C0995_014790 [Termitomyces sp. Mi166\
MPLTIAVHHASTPLVTTVHHSNQSLPLVAPPYPAPHTTAPFPLDTMFTMFADSGMGIRSLVLTWKPVAGAGSVDGTGIAKEDIVNVDGLLTEPTPLPLTSLFNLQADFVGCAECLEGPVFNDNTALGSDVQVEVVIL